MGSPGQACGVTLSPALLGLTPERGGEAENKYAIGLNTEDLLKLVAVRTRLVAILACGNILGQLLGVAQTVKSSQRAVAERLEGVVSCSTDRVAYAPDRQIDIQA